MFESKNQTLEELIRLGVPAARNIGSQSTIGGVYANYSSSYCKSGRTSRDHRGTRRQNQGT